MASSPNKFLEVARTYASLVRFSHTIFALPFAAAALIWAIAAAPLYLFEPVEGTNYFSRIELYPQFSWAKLGLILLAMVGARTFAMALNRILDRHIDALNPRTAQREIPAGRVSVGNAWNLALASAGVYLFACAALSHVTLYLAPIPLAIMAVYPLTKRFTWLCHYVLGAALGLAPVGAWVAMRAGFSPLLGAEVTDEGWVALRHLAPWFLGAAVALWVAGFDIIYALQDDEFDRQQKLHSIPARFGRKGALFIARLTHNASALLFFLALINLMVYRDNFGWYHRPEVLLHPLAWAAPVVMLLGMAWQQSLVKADDLSKVNLAFFTVNGVISLLFGLITLAAHLTAVFTGAGDASP